MSSPAEQQQERISLGLIEYLSRHTLDEDYARVARERPAGTTTGRFGMLPLLLTLALFGLLVFTAASQTTRNATTEARDRSQLIQQVTARRSGVDARNAEVARLRSDNKALDTQALIGSQSGAGVFAALQRLSTLTGASAVTGPGVKVVVDDAPNATSDRNKVLDSDLQKLVNGLWESGAEAISVNGQRVTNLTSIREAGAAINVNYRPLTAPYTVLAIGDPKTIPSRFAQTTHGATWFDLQQQVGLRFSMQPDSSLTLPAADQLSLRYATRIKKESR
jgi:uncharacterized protein YlxW (UPF0749 family)